MYKIKQSSIVWSDENVITFTLSFSNIGATRVKSRDMVKNLEALA